MVNYDHIRTEMDRLADDAIDSMKQLGRFDKNAMKVAQEAERSAANYKRAIAIVSEKPKPKSKVIE